MNHAIFVKNLNKNFRIESKTETLWGKFKAVFNPKYENITAVNNVSFNVKKGELVAFIGPNGAGKSTTIKMLTGILSSSSGEINVLGVNPFEKRTEIAFLIGTVFGQKSQLWYNLPPIDTFDLIKNIYEIDNKVYKERLDKLISIFEIGDFLNNPVRKLSLGQRMKCEIVASLLHGPQILFLDEPTIGLDIIAKQQVRKELKRLNKIDNVTIFLTSHDTSDIEALAKRTIIVNHGKIIFDGPTENLKRNFINSKTVQIIFEEELVNFNYPGVKILEQDPYMIKVECEKSISGIEKIVDYAIENFKVIDINIEDTPLEKIISSIYRRKDIHV